MVSTRRSAKQFALGQRGGIYHCEASIRQHCLERGRELSRAIADEQPEPREVFGEVHYQVAGLLGGPGPVGMRGYA
ncbi:MAG: hypothetical protein JWQ60_109 [Pseudonocardia sp.]|nr:hypothetical protein [Pseudonocardia sp.]